MNEIEFFLRELGLYDARHEQRKDRCNRPEKEAPGVVCKQQVLNMLVPKNIVKNNESTIFFWTDGTKTIIKRDKNDPDDAKHAYHFAVLKYLTGSARQAIDCSTRVENMYAEAEKKWESAETRKAQKKAKKKTKKKTKN